MRAIDELASSPEVTTAAVVSLALMLRDRSNACDALAKARHLSLAEGSYQLRASGDRLHVLGKSLRLAAEESGGKHIWLVKIAFGQPGPALWRGHASLRKSRQRPLQ